MEDNQPPQQAPPDEPPAGSPALDITPPDVNERELQGGDSPCWAHLLDEEGRLD